MNRKFKLRRWCHGTGRLKQLCSEQGGPYRNDKIGCKGGRQKNITANCIAPGFIMTEMTAVLPDAVKTAAKQIIPVRRFGRVEDVAKAIAFLTSDESGYITGQVLCVDGGMAM